MTAPLRTLWNRTWICTNRNLVLHFDTGIPYQKAFLWTMHQGMRYHARVKERPKEPVVLKPALPLIPNSYRGGAQGVLRFDYDDIVEKGGNSFDVSYTVGSIIGDVVEDRLYLSRNPLPNRTLPPLELRPMCLRFEFHP